MFKFMTLAIMTTAMGAASAADPQQLGFTSIGKVRIGMSERDLVRALGGRLTDIDPEAEEEGCYYASGRGLPKGVGLMMVNGRLARIDVTEHDVKTISGAGVGTSESELKRLYGSRLVQEPHAYIEPDGHYFTLRSTDRRYGVRFETDGGAVTGFYAGTAKAIRYVEGCQ